MTIEEFEKESATIYRVIGIHTSVPMIDNHVDYECETFERAVELAEELKGTYRYVYIRKETEYIYQLD